MTDHVMYVSVADIAPTTRVTVELLAADGTVVASTSSTIPTADFILDDGDEASGMTVDELLSSIDNAIHENGGLPPELPVVPGDAP